MTETTGTWDAPEPPASGRPRNRGRKMKVIAALVVVLLIGGFFLGRALWWSLRPAPDFPALADSPDDSLHGTVAFLKPYPDDNCLYVVAASGANSKKVTCVEGAEGGGSLEWLDAERIQITGYGNAQEPDKWRKIVDVATGDVEDVAKDDIPAETDPPTESPGPNGEVVTSKSKKGTLTVTLTTDAGTRELLSVGAPETYTFGLPAWSSDGEWFVVKDDRDRLLLVTTADPSQTRVLVEGGWGQALTDADILVGS